MRDPELFKGKNIVICGGGDSALDWTLNLVGKAESVVLIHRRDGFRAQTASVAKMKELCENWEMQFEVGQVTGFEEKDGRMTEIRVTGADGVTRRMPLDHLLVFFGLQPKIGPIADWGLQLERKQIVVDTEKFESSIPGISPWVTSTPIPARKSSFFQAFMSVLWPPSAPRTTSSRKRRFSCSTRPQARNCIRCWAWKRRISMINPGL